jgi:cell cycle arrest protein BUB3
MMSSSSSLETELNDPPTDGITTVNFANKSDLLLVASWDKGVRLYDARKNALRHTYEHKAAVFDCCFSDDDSKIFSAGLDHSLMQYDFATGAATKLGSHDQAIKCVAFNASTGLVVTGGWDSKICMWDPREAKPLAGQVVVAEGCKVYTMDMNDNRLVVGTSGRHVKIYDVRNMATPEQERESSLMNQTRCIRIFPNNTGYALSSIEGRVAIEYFDPFPSVQKNKYAFKCHRKTVNGVSSLFPVNAIAFHPVHGTFATGGCDGVINVWDGANKKRICQYPPYQTSVASLCFNKAGDMLAVAASYTYEEGEKDHPPDAVFVRTINAHEVMPKAKKKK